MEIELTGIKFDVDCKVCGAGLESEMKFIGYDGRRALQVEPCKKCIEAAIQEERDSNFDSPLDLN